MGIADGFWIVSIVGGAGYLLYRSIWKKNGRCQGCDNAACSRRQAGGPAALLGCLLVATAPAGAAEAPTAAASPTQGDAELYHTPAEKLAVGQGSSITKHVTISGLLEVEASVTESGSDLTLATAQLGMAMKVDEHLGGTLVLLAEDGGAPAVDEATIDVAAGPWSVRAGEQLLPFGRYNSHFVTDPLTLDLGETRDTAIVAGFKTRRYVLSAFVFRGDAREAGGQERIEDWGAALTVTPAEGWEVGMSYLSDLADSDTKLFADAGNTYHRRVAGWSAYATGVLGPIEMSAEALGAVEGFAEDDGGGRPRAWNFEMAYDPAPNLEVAVRYEWGDDPHDAVDRRYGVAASWSPRDQMGLTAEFLHAEMGGAGEENMVSARLAFEF